MNSKVTTNSTSTNKKKSSSTIPECPYEIPISTIYNPSTNQSTVPIVSIYNPNLNQNTRPPEEEHKSKGKFINALCIENLKIQFHKDHRKKVEFYMAVCLLITLVATGVVIVIMHKSTTKDTLLVHGEFTVLNSKYTSELSHRNSSRFLIMSKNICRAVDKTFLVPGLGDFYRSCKVTSISPQFNVHVVLTFSNDPSVTIGKIGLTFIKGFRILHGKTWMNEFSLNVQSIGFMVSGEEGIWGDWSEWSQCNQFNISTRTRPCLTKTGIRLNSVDRCLLIPGNKSDLDIKKCNTSDEVEEDGVIELIEPQLPDEIIQTINKTNITIVTSKEITSTSTESVENVRSSVDNVPSKDNASSKAIDSTDEINTSSTEKPITENVNQNENISTSTESSTKVENRIRKERTD